MPFYIFRQMKKILTLLTLLPLFACGSSQTARITKRPMVASMQPMAPAPVEVEERDESASAHLERAFHAFRIAEYENAALSFEAAIGTNNLNDSGRALAYWHVYLCRAQNGDEDAAADALMSFTVVAEDMLDDSDQFSHEYLSSRDFVERFTRHEADLRRFVRSMMPSWHDADEVMQQVALVAWRKFDQFDQSTEFIKWACVIARFECLAYRRKMARDRLVFNEELMGLMAEEAGEEEERRQLENAALEGCLQKLSEQQRTFVLLAYTPGCSTKEMAEQAGVKPGTFYMRLNRIRKGLQDCIRQNITQEGLA